MKKILVVILCLFTLCGCTGPKVADTYRADYAKINQKKAERLIDEGNTYLIDVRSKQEYKDKHIDKAINIPLDKIDDITNQISKDSIVIVYCQSGTRSKKAALKIIDMGYSVVYDLGSIDNWK